MRTPHPGDGDPAGAGISAAPSGETRARLQSLEDLLESLGRVAVGFSGGVDSAFLAAVCERCISERTLLVHLDNPLMGTPERASFDLLRDRLNLPLEVVRFDPLRDSAIAANGRDRCYRCKLAGFGLIADVARRWGATCVVDGSNADDEGDFRPGMRALRELGVRSPLMEAGWRKSEERELLRTWGFSMHDLPAGACLATRIACGEPLAPPALDLIRSCEDLLHERGFRQVRARLAGGCLQIECAAEDLGGLEAQTSTVIADLERIVTPQGVAINPRFKPYAQGAMNDPSDA